MARDRNKEPIIRENPQERVNVDEVIQQLMMSSSEFNFGEMKNQETDEIPAVDDFGNQYTRSAAGFDKDSNEQNFLPTEERTEREIPGQGQAARGPRFVMPDTHVMNTLRQQFGLRQTPPATELQAPHVGGTMPQMPDVYRMRTETGTPYARYPYDFVFPRDGSVGQESRQTHMDAATQDGIHTGFESKQFGRDENDTQLTTSYAHMSDEPLPQNDERSDKQRRNPLAVIKHAPRRYKVGAAVVALGLAVPGGMFAKGQIDETARVNMVAAESAKFEGGLMPELLNCQDSDNALNLQMVTVTQNGLSAKVRMRTPRDEKETWGRFPTSARMVASAAIALCASKNEENIGKPFAYYENGQWHVNRSAIVIDSVGKLKVPTCGIGEIQGNAPGCTVPIPRAWYDGDKEITPDNKEGYAMTEADKKWALELVAKKPELNDVQKQFMSDATLQLYTKGLGEFDVAGNSCSDAVDSHMNKLVQELSRKKYNAVPENQQVVFEGKYGSLAARTLGGVIGEANGKPITVTDRLSKSFVEVDDSLKTECHVATADEAKASTAPPPQASPPVAAHTSRS